MNWLHTFAATSVLAFVVCAGGFVLTLGDTIGPWAGWLAGVIISGVAMWFTVSAVMEERTLRRDREAVATRASFTPPNHTPEP